jgi:ABC-type maltose transport system permease subunit
MDPSFLHYIKQILKTLVVVLVWMTINIKYGIMENYAFPEAGFTTGNYIFYSCFIISLTLVIIYLIKIWNKPYTQNK